MKISFQYGERISQYLFEDGQEKPKSQKMIVNDGSPAGKDELRIDIWKCAAELEEYKKIFTENKKFMDLFFEELYVEVTVCDGNPNYSRAYLGRLFVVFDWLQGKIQDMPPPEPEMMYEYGEDAYKQLKKLKDEIES